MSTAQPQATEITKSTHICTTQELPVRLAEAVYSGDMAGNTQPICMLHTGPAHHVFCRTCHVVMYSSEVDALCIGS